MKLRVLVRHTFDNRTYDVGDTYEVADDLLLDGSPVTVAETIIGNGMARRDDRGVTADEPTPPAPPVDHRGEHTKHRKASP
jgi:hypothetical protein